jgi:PAP2 superfamily
MAKQPTRSTKPVKAIAPAPKPMTVTPPGVPNPKTSTLPPPPGPFKPFAVTPPSAPAPKRLLEFAQTAEKLRGKVTRKPEPPTPSVPTDPSTIPGFEDWAPNVRVLLAVTQAVSMLELGTASSQCTLSVRAGGTVTHLHTTARPSSSDYQNLKPSGTGIGALKQKLNGRKGHEDEILACDDDVDHLFLATIGLDQRRAPRTMDVIRATIEITGVAVHWFKNEFKIPRPYQLQGVFEWPTPVLEHPGHSSFPGGHAAQAWAVAKVLGELAADRVKDKTGAFDGVATIVAESREFAGLHYPLDTEAGKGLGVAIGSFLATSHGAFARFDELWKLAVNELALLGP